jgi:glucose-1-phosphate adenylyltransferase
MNKAVALILAGGRGDRLSILSEERAKPAVIFGGKYRIIDFTLSNCVNSGIYHVGLLTQYRPRSLNDHIGIGKHWDLDRLGGGVFLLQPYLGRSASDWYKNTADAVYQNLSFIEESRAELVLVLAGDHVYRMRYDQFIDCHRTQKADCTVGVVQVPLEEGSRFGIVALDEEHRIVEFQEKPARPRSNLASMGIYVFNKEVLVERLIKDSGDSTSTHDFGRDIIPGMITSHKVFGHVFNGFWVDVGTIESYWRANMELTADLPRLNLYDQENPLFTKVQNRPPAKSGPWAQVTRSLVSEGCIINGTVRNSVLSPGVYVDHGAIVEDSIIFDDTFVGNRAHVHRSIVDKEVHIGAEAHIGWSDDLTPNVEEPQYLNSGITLIGKRAHVPPQCLIGRNCKVHPGVQEAHFLSGAIASGQVVRASV